MRKGHFKKGEIVIATDPFYAYMYAKYILKGRWKRGEKAIAQDELWSLSYVREVSKRRFKLGEAAMKRDEKIFQVYENFLKVLKEEGQNG